MKNILLPAAWVKPCTVVIVALCIALSWSNVLERSSKNSVDGILVQAVSAYGVARIVNGTISLLQSVEISVPVVGGAAVSPLAVLSPWNDLIDRFSVLMEVSIGSLVVQKLFIELVSTFWFQSIFALSGMLFLVSLYFPGVLPTGIWFKGFLSCLFIRYAVLVVVLLNGLVDQGFLRAKTTEDIGNMTHISASLDDAGSSPEEAEKRRVIRATIATLEQEKNKMMQLRQQQEAQRLQAQQALDVATEDVRPAKRAIYERQQTILRQSDAVIVGLDKQIETAQQSLDGRATRLMKAIASGGRELLESVVTKMNGYIDSVLRLMAVFVLQTMLLPLLFFWGLRQAMKAVWQIDVAAYWQKSTGNR
jgi:hypothetical protein